jgi:hypothetical protein
VAKARSSPALWTQDRAFFLQSQPLHAALALPLQHALFDEWPAHRDALSAEERPVFAGNLVLAVADPGIRVDHFVRRLARAHTALALALEQPATALWPLSRLGFWRPSLWAQRHLPMVRARRLADVLDMKPRFNGALWFGAEDALAALRLWFWAERLGAFPGGLVAVWTPPGGALMLRLCAHGNLHVEAYGAAALDALQTFAPDCGWATVQGPCISAWQQGTAIPGRHLRV